MKTEPKYYFKKINELPFLEIFETENIWKILNERDKFFLQFNESNIKGHVSETVYLEGIIIIEKGAKILNGSTIKGPVYIGKNSIIGPNAYIREKTIIGNNCKIGSGEIKGSIIMNNARVDHFGYIGDSILGDSSHIGAGVVTTNLRFDNKNLKENIRKYGLVLGDNSQLGSNVTTLPGTFVGPDSWVYPGVVLKEFVPVSSIVKYKPNYSIVEKNK